MKEIKCYTWSQICQMVPSLYKYIDEKIKPSMVEEILNTLHEFAHEGYMFSYLFGAGNEAIFVFKLIQY